MKYFNPIIKGFNPDPSICRVDHDYYLVTSSFEFFPGIPIYHSTDLVNWEQIGNCIEDASLFPYDTTKLSGGIWAPTIRYHEGTFYVTAKFEGFGNFILHTKDPAQGWSKPLKIALGGIDPSILFDEGHVYYCTNQGTPDRRPGISVVEINIETGEFLSEVKQVWGGTGGGYMEAPHIYHIGSWYYLVVAEGGTGLQHMINIARAKNIWGPYEDCPENPILTNRNDATKAIACAGHGDLVEDENGNWWMVHLGTRPTFVWYSHIGRESFLMPVTWHEGWPRIGEDHKSHIEVDGPIWAKQENAKKWDADFSTIQPQFLFIRAPKKDQYHLANRHLFMTPSTAKLETPDVSPTCLVVRPMNIDFIMSVELKFVPVCNGDEAGITIYQNNDFHYCLFKKREHDKNYICVTKRAGDFFQEVYRRETIDDGSLTFTVEATRTSFTFSEAGSGQPVTIAAECDSRFLSCEFVGRCFTGILAGVYTSCEEATDAVAEVVSFSMCDNSF